MANKSTRTYSDFDFLFKPHPLTGDIQKKFDEEAIKKSVFNLISLSRNDKPFRPEINSDIDSLLFEPLSTSTAIAIRSRIEFVLGQFEPRINITDVHVVANSIKDGYDITISYIILNTISEIDQRIFIQRVR